MNRRDAIAALVALPAVTRITKADLKSTDVIVVECSEFLTDDNRKNITTALQQIWPDQRIVVLDRQMRLKVVAGTKRP